MTTYLGKSCSFCLPRVPFVNCRQFMYLVISLLVLRAGYGIWLYQFLIIAYLFTSVLCKDKIRWNVWHTVEIWSKRVGSVFGMCEPVRIKHVCSPLSAFRQLFCYVASKQQRDWSDCAYPGSRRSSFYIWAWARQHKQNDMCDQRRLRDVWISAHSDQSSLCALWGMSDNSDLGRFGPW